MHYSPSLISVSLNLKRDNRTGEYGVLPSLSAHSLDSVSTRSSVQQHPSPPENLRVDIIMQRHRTPESGTGKKRKKKVREEKKNEVEYLTI